MMSKYDNYHLCPMCGGQNDYTLVEYVNFKPCEIKTCCTSCGWEDYWAYGFYEGRVEETYDKYVESARGMVSGV